MACQGSYRCAGCIHCATVDQRRPLTGREEARIARALRNHPPIHGPRPLRLVQAEQGTTSYGAPEACDGTMTCDCARCQQQRLVLINLGPKKVRQPWERAA
jgi:hypothetical protein